MLATAALDLYRQLLPRLMQQRRDDGCGWRGQLSSSALSTAVACIAYRVCQHNESGRAAGLRWLAAHQNKDGGWGDTTASPSNTSTSLLVWSALAGSEERAAAMQLERYLRRQLGSLSATAVVAHIEQKYGKDRTFAVPILAACALAGRLGPDETAWSQVRQLPFELAVLPRRFFTLIRMPVVSYALPALISIGLLVHRRRSGLSLLGPLRGFVADRCLAILQRMQPSSGGFLEATPLTAFVAMSLYGAGETEDPVLRQSLDFLDQSQRGDGAWPIDSDLANWVTSLAVNACRVEDLPEREALLTHIQAQQSEREHPFTGAAPGGWAWTDLPGGVPDADDTAGALIALRRLAGAAAAPRALAGLAWLRGVHNRDGGIPTFCRGWGSLPFDQSSPDITAHALRAFDAWRKDVDSADLMKARADCLRYLEQQQTLEGAWNPLWFGHQGHPQQQNPLYGTSRVLLALADADRLAAGARQARQRGVRFLLAQQLPDGGWSSGGVGTVEETALVLEALALCRDVDPSVRAACQRGLQWLTRAWQQPVVPQPIGLYFASLWYDEALYPLVFSLAACRRFVER